MREDDGKEEGKGTKKGTEKESRERMKDYAQQLQLGDQDWKGKREEGKINTLKRSFVALGM